MKVDVSTDSNIDGREKLTIHVQAVVEQTLERFARRISRVEVHLTDVNSHKNGHDDTRCMMEVRLEGRPPSAVTHLAPTLERAVDGACGRLKRLIESTLGREGTLEGLRDHR